ncbi:MAG: energy transducer TonB [Thermodesulfobacteriota bacterium]|nr:energy transducer TonB [Thermodesulfobacteriota bacterium]
MGGIYPTNQHESSRMMLDEKIKMAEEKKKSNRVMQVMIAVSLGIHLVLFMHIAGIYRSEALTRIELTLRDVSKPEGRAIPRPRKRRQAPKAEDVKQLDVADQQIPKINTDPVANAPDSIAESIAVPDVPASGWSGGTDTGIGEQAFVTADDYFEMIRLKIESRKQYPDAARKQNHEGRVNVRFLITSDGMVSSLEIAKEARHELLNKAALEAVRSAAPFPRPPADMFDGPLRIEVTVMFQLT